MTASFCLRVADQTVCVFCCNCECIRSSIHTLLQFDSLALGCLKLGRGEEAEQLFDERDYL